MSRRYSFYELRQRRHESDGSTRRCFQAVGEPTQVLFVWELEATPLVHAQLLLGDETFVEWRVASVVAGATNRGAITTAASSAGAPHARHKGVRTLEGTGDSRVLDRAREVLAGSDLPAPLVQTLIARLNDTASH